MIEGRNINLYIISKHIVIICLWLNKLLPSGNLVFELPDHEFLFGNHRFHHISDRNQPNQLPVFQNRQMSNSLIRHQCHTVIDVWSGRTVNHLRTHDLPHGRISGRFAH